MKFLPFSLALNVGHYEFAMAAGKDEPCEEITSAVAETELVFGFVADDEDDEYFEDLPEEM